MHLESELIEELNLLVRYQRSPSPNGIEVGQTAEPGLISAAERLFKKGIVERKDGGPLTDRGRETLNHMTRLLSQLQPPLEPI